MQRFKKMVVNCLQQSYMKNNFKNRSPLVIDKMYRSFTLIILSILSTSCNYSQGTDQPLQVKIKVTRQYDQTFDKETYYFGSEKNGYEVLGDSLQEQIFDISVELKNSSRESIYLWLMSCSWGDNFIINNDYMFPKGQECNSNYPKRIELKAGGSQEYIMTLTKSIKFAYPCKGCIYGKQVEATKLGLIVLNDIFKNEYIDYTTYMNDKSKWKIYWSNSLYLLTSKELNPEPITIPVYKKN